MYIVGIVGPSACGKSTLARRGSLEYGCNRLKLDAFYRDVSTFAYVGSWRNWELPENLRLDQFVDALRTLRIGDVATVPVFSKSQGRQRGTHLLWPTPLLIVEGFLLLHDPRVRPLLDLAIYLDVSLGAQRSRRLNREPGIDSDYFDRVVVPSYERHGVLARRSCDLVIDANEDEDHVWEAFNAAVTDRRATA